MVWLLIAVKNALRRKTRSLLTVCGVAIAVSILFGLLSFQRGFENSLKDELSALGAHIMLVPKGCPYEASTILIHGGKWPKYMGEEHLLRVRGAGGVRSATGLIMDASLGTTEQENRIFVGIEKDYLAFRPGWKLDGGWFGDKPSMILGAEAAKRENLKPGDRLFLPDRKMFFLISGILEKNNTQDDNFYFLKKSTLQQAFNLPGKLVAILVKAKDPERVDTVVEDLRKLEPDLNVFPVSQVLATAKELMERTRIFVLAAVIIAIAVGALGVLNTVLMAVFERRKEIGMMKAIGASRSDIFRIILSETAVLCLLGGILGVAISMVSSRAVEVFLRKILPYSPKGGLISFSFDIFAGCILFSILLGVLAGFYPAFRAANVKPVEAMVGE